MIQETARQSLETRTGEAFGSPLRPRVAVAVALIGGLATVSACSGGPPVEMGGPMTLSTGNASNPTVAVSENGVRYVAWVQTNADGGDVYLSTVGADGVPAGTPVRVNDIPGDADPHEQAPPQVALSPEGDVVVVWQRKVEAPWLDYGGADLRFARSTDGGRSFLPAVTVNDNASESPVRISFHDIAFGQDGAIFVSWIDARVRDSAREQAYREGVSNDSMSSDGSTDQGMSSAGMTGDSMASAGMPHEGMSNGSMSHDAMSHDGAAARMLPLDEEPGTEIRLTVSHDGGATFAPSLVIDGITCPCCRTSLATGPDGVVYVAWRKVFDGGIRDIAVARSTDGGATFGPVRRVHTDDWEFDGCPHAGPSLALDADGRLHVAWYTGKPDSQGLWYAVSDDNGESFSEPIAILTDSFVPASQARLGIVDGEVWVAWDDLRTDTPKVGFGTISGGRLNTVGGGFEGHAPSLTVSGTRGALAWLDNDEVRMVSLATPED